MDEYSIGWLFDRDPWHETSRIATYLWMVGVGMVLVGPLVMLVRLVVRAFL